MARSRAAADWVVEEARAWAEGTAMMRTSNITTSHQLNRQ